MTRPNSFRLDQLDHDLGDEIKQLPPMLEVGATGLQRSGGYITDEFLPQLRGRQAIKVYREMADNSAVLGAWIYTVKQLLRQIEWRVEPASSKKDDKDNAEFVEQCLGDMEQSFADFISEACSMMIYGWSAHEIVFKKRQGLWSKDPRHQSKFSDGRLGWRKLPIRSQDSLLRWVFAENGDVEGMVQMPAPRYQKITLPIKKLLLLRPDLNKGSPEGRSLIRGAYRCFDQDTEILTRQGWRRGVELTGQEELATLVGDALVYEKPSAVHRYHHEGELLSFTSRHLDMLVTDNHRMWARRDHKDHFEWIDADQVPVSASYKRDAAWNADDLEFHTVPAVTYASPARTLGPVVIPMDDWLTFLGWFYSEGHTNKPGRQQYVVITQNEGPKADLIRGVLARLPWHVYEHKSGRKINFEICDKQLWTHLHDGRRAPAKDVPRYVGECSPRQIALFLDSYLLGDGSDGGGDLRERDGRPFDGTDCIYTSSPAMADSLSELILKTGYCPKITNMRTSDQHHGGPMYRVSYGKPTARLQAKRIESVAYDGMVWCPTTTSGVVYVRRNGKSNWSGNSWFMTKRFEEIEAVGVERDLTGLPVAFVPPNVLNPRPGSDDAKMLEAVKKAVQAVRRNEQEGLVWPLMFDDDGNKQYDFQLLTSGGSRQFDVGAIIQRYETRMLMSVMADFIMTGHENSGSSYALHTDKSGIFETGVNGIARAFADPFNRKAIPQLFKLNGMQPDDLPTLVPNNVNPPDLAQLASFIGTTSGAGMQWFPDGELEKFIRDAAQLPKADPEMIKVHDTQMRQQAILALAQQKMEAMQMQMQVAQGEQQMMQGEQQTVQGAQQIAGTAQSQQIEVQQAKKEAQTPPKPAAKPKGKGVGSR